MIKFIKEHYVFTFLVISVIIITGSIHTSDWLDYKKQVAIDEQIRLEYEAEQARLREALAHAGDNKITKEISHQVLNDLAIKLDSYNFSYFHCRISDDTVYYEIALDRVSYFNIRPVLDIYKKKVNNICTDLRWAWYNKGVGANISVSLLSYNNYEQVLLISENSSIVFDAFKIYR